VAKRRGVRGRYWLLTPTERAAIVARFREGALVREVMAEFGVPRTSLWRIQDEAALTRWRVVASPRRLSFEERERIFVGVCQGESDSEIARALGRHRSTVGREIRRCAERRAYRPLRAERTARLLARRPKPTKLSRSARLVAMVEQGLVRRWSPQQISARLRVDHLDDQGMRISHETIYRSLYVQSRGELRRQLAANLRSGRATRRSKKHIEGRRERIAEMVPIAQRPPEIDERRVPGHWEGDLLIGAASKSAIATLVERQTRYVLLARLGRDRSTAHVIDALKARITELSGDLVKSLTWDRGIELAAHKHFTSDTGIQVYFCDPHAPWQRGSNENANGLLRQYLPRKLDLAARTQVELDQIAAELNGRPRKTLHWNTPAEKMQALLR
jgi:transposase, IS30 family